MIIRIKVYSIKFVITMYYKKISQSNLSLSIFFSFGRKKLFWELLYIRFKFFSKKYLFY